MKGKCLNNTVLTAFTILATAILLMCSGCAGNKSTAESGKTIPGAIHENIAYGRESRQWLNIYQAPSIVPTPIYIWAHANNHTAAGTGVARTGSLPYISSVNLIPLNG